MSKKTEALFDLPNDSMLSHKEFLRNHAMRPNKVNINDVVIEN